MSEVELSNGASDDDCLLQNGAAEAAEEQLDDETAALLKELEASQLEVQRMIEAQREQASELGGMKEHLASELQQLQDDAWKLQVFAELEMLKRQLAAINNLDADLDAMEARLEEGGEEAVNDEFEKELEAARAETLDMLSRMDVPTTSGAGKAGRSGGDASTTGASSSAAAAGVTAAGGEDEGEAGGEDAGGSSGDGEDVEALQDELDAELAAMYKQLQAIKTESALVSARKAQLELELMQLIREGADDLSSQLKELNMEEEGGEEEEEDAKGEEEKGTAGEEGAPPAAEDVAATTA
ncbi:hypothetical protein Agub_g14817 [Astrephomene gubernaculifera]|uniref:Uncharacterized protein n=1 Tax=Astrephomene gubernaculifera TaxID=47775 RepID=A0AAD3E2A8_9CHLO|nr:hypothetical protein Agub_g14817 [Astrephomene gubernaculifera]